MKNNEKGITLVALVITIIMLLILASVTISAGKNSIREASEDTQFAELKEVQTAIIEKKMKADLAPGINLPGDAVTESEMENIASEMGITVTWKENKFYRLNTDSLKELGIINTSDEFIVSYETYEVINATQLNSATGEALYLSGIS